MVTDRRQGQDPRAEQRRDAAARRQKEREARTAAEQLALLDERPGDAARERKHLTGGDG